MNAELKNLDISKEFERIERLGNCEVCQNNAAKYTCPKCEIKSCCLDCSKIHKKELTCDGLRDRTKYIPLKNMTSVDFMNDYYFLEECIRFVKDKKNKKSIHKTFRGVPKKFMKLKKMASERKIQLFYMVDELKKRKENDSAVDSIKNIIYWHSEFIFVNSDNLTISEKFSEDEKISDILLQFLNNKTLHKSLEFYRANGVKKIQVLLKAEGLKGSRFYQMDLNKSMKKNLANKIIIEFPVFYVVMDHSAGDFELVDSDDETVEQEKEEFQKTIYQEIFHVNTDNSDRNTKKRKLQEGADESTEVPVKAKPDDIETEVKTEIKNQNIEDSDDDIEPENFLFSKDDD